MDSRVREKLHRRSHHCRNSTFKTNIFISADRHIPWGSGSATFCYMSQLVIAQWLTSLVRLHLMSRSVNDGRERAQEFRCILSMLIWQLTIGGPPNQAWSHFLENPSHRFSRLFGKTRTGPVIYNVLANSFFENYVILVIILVIVIIVVGQAIF
uniref:Uncharacterized protein n=1 Tax=Ornithodoros erraticus TaxID=265619 RepID=A0A293M513_ORNER